MPKRNIPKRRADGRKLKKWEIKAQTSVDINKNLNGFLEHIEDERLGLGLAAITEELIRIYKDNDDKTRRFTHSLQRRSQKGCEGLDNGRQIPEKWAQQMDGWLKIQFAVLSEKFNRRERIFSKALASRDSKAFKKRKAALIDEEKKLLKLFWKVKRSIDSKESKTKKATSTLELQSPAKITTTKATTTGFAAAPHTMLHSNLTRAVSTPNEHMPAIPNKKRKITAYYDLTGSPGPMNN